jgi:ABC-type lipoprotein export system ATPase subunit
VSDGELEPHPPVSVRLEAVSKRFHAGEPDEVRALRELSLEVGPGAFVSIEGPSGGGKTTLLNVIGLLERPSSGSVLWNRQATNALSEGERSRLRLTGVGFIFQRFFLVPTLTARENVELPQRALRVPRAERRRRAEGLLGQVGLTHRGDAYPHQLSGGEEQRVAVARALANRPGLLLADEPTGELDRVNTEAVLDLLVHVHRSTGASLIVVTHNPAVAARADRHLRIADGAILSDTGGG